MSAGFLEHPGKRQRNFEKRPTIEPSQIYRRGLDTVMDLERKAFVRGSAKTASNRRRPLAQRQFPPNLTLLTESLKFGVIFKNRFKRQFSSH
jgi:hypothetical protein